MSIADTESPETDDTLPLGTAVAEEVVRAGVDAIEKGQRWEFDLQDGRDGRFEAIDLIEMEDYFHLVLTRYIVKVPELTISLRSSFTSTLMTHIL